MLTRQEIFDKSVLHLRRQGKKSINTKAGYGCLYRNQDGLGCGLAPFIDFDQYDPSVEGKVVTDVELQSIMPNIDFDSKVTKKLMNALQIVHDSYEVDKWPQQWCEVAQDYRLNAYIVCQPLEECRNDDA